MSDKVYVYRNLHRNCWSVSNGKTVRYHTHFLILQDVKFKVREQGRLKVLREKRKNVHAFIIGTPTDQKTVSIVDTWKQITYDPYKYETFVIINTKEPIYEAKEVVMRFTGDKAEVWAR